MVEKQLLFIDGSVNNQLKIGCGAALLLNENEVSGIDLKEKIVIQTFANTSSTKLELQTLLWALGQLAYTDKKVIVFTDSQNIVRLNDRRLTLEQNDYHAAKGKLLNHHELYREFFKITEQIECDFVKVEGHQAKRSKDQYDHLFTLVDRASRQALRNLKT